jgi:FkbM family methyltransferase
MVSFGFWLTGKFGSAAQRRRDTPCGFVVSNLVERVLTPLTWEFFSMPLRPEIRKAIAKASARPSGQAFLQRVVLYAQRLMGIGAGTDVFESGEQGVFTTLRERCSPPYFVFDVGANRGNYVSLLQNRMDPRNLSIHCFEPASHTYGLLAKKCGDQDDIKLNNFALGETAGRKHLYFDRPGSGLASFTKRNFEHSDRNFGREEEIEVRTLDGYCQRRDISSIDLLKIDVEGHELDVLEGGRDLFENGRIDITTFEFGGCNIDTRTYLRDFFDFFRPLGLTLYRITPTGYIYPLNNYRECQEQFRTTNYLAMEKRPC